MRRPLALLLLGSAVALAGDEAVKIKKAKPLAKGDEEQLVVIAMLDRRNKDGDRVYQKLATQVKRTIDAMGEDGLPARETLEFFGGSLYDDPMDDTNGDDLTGFSAKIERSKSRRAQGEIAFPDETIDQAILRGLRADPDLAARILLPKDAVKIDETWEVDAKKLLQLAGPNRAKLVADDSTAEAKLETVKKKDGEVVFKITFKASLVYAPGSDPDARETLKVTGTLKGPVDGSTAPSFEVSAKKKLKNGGSETFSLSVDRKPPEEEQSDGDDDKKDDAKKKKEEKK